MTTTTTEQPKRDLFAVFLSAACVVLAVFVLLLAWQNRSLKQRLAAAQTASAPDSLRAGDRLPAFDVVAAGSGEKTHVGFGVDGERTLLLVFSPDCPACRQNMPTWREILTTSSPAGYRIMGIRTALAGHGENSSQQEEVLPFPVYTTESKAPLEKVPYIPATVVLDRDGTVLKVWFGMLTPDQATELKQQLATTTTSSSERWR